MREFRQRYAGFGPKAGHDDLLLAGFLNGRNELLVVPGVHAGTFDRNLIGKLVCSCGQMKPLKLFVSTVDSTFGTAKIQAALARMMFFSITD
jgi:hypothetical protein